MHIPAVILPASSLLRRAPLQALAGGACLLLAAVAVACGGDDDDADPTPTRGAASIASATATRAAEATATPTIQRVGGTLVPLDTATPAPASTQAPGTPVPTPEPAAMTDMAPCDAQTYFSEVTVNGDTPVLAYKDVPVGTPILFPFERGRLLEIDSRSEAMLLFYEVPGLGIFSIQAAGTSTLDRNAADVVRGSVIGHFGPAFDSDVTETFEGYQLFALLGDAQMVVIGDTVYAGQAIDPNVTDCLVLQ